MSRILAKAAFVAVALAGFAGGATAADIEISIRTSERGGGHTSYYGGGDLLPPRAIPSRHVYRADDEDEVRFVAPRHSGYEYRDPNRYYGRPVPERHSWYGHRPAYGGGYGSGYGSPYGYGRPVAARPHWGGDCRVVVKHKLNRWGEQVVKRTTVCD